MGEALGGEEDADRGGGGVLEDVVEERLLLLGVERGRVGGWSGRRGVEGQVPEGVRVGSGQVADHRLEEVRQSARGDEAHLGEGDRGP